MQDHWRYVAPPAYITAAAAAGFKPETRPGDEMDPEEFFQALTGMGY